MVKEGRRTGIRWKRPYAMIGEAIIIRVGLQVE